MQTLQAVVVGIVQGLSEFLPISSSAHITFSNEIFHIITGAVLSNEPNSEEIFFDIMVHLATLFAVIIYFFGDLRNIFSEFFKSIKEKNYKNENFLLVNYIALSTIITGVIGLLLKESVEKLIVNPKIICILLMITGFILLLSEKMYKGNQKINLKKSVAIAIAQGLAVFPGFSRSGLTIAAGLFLGMDRVKAARFSFLMSIPVILLASMIYPLLELDFSQIMNFNLKAITIGFFSAFISGYLCVKYFMKLLGRLSLRTFGYYCLAASLAMYLLFQFCGHQ